MSIRGQSNTLLGVLCAVGMGTFTIYTWVSWPCSRRRFSHLNLAWLDSACNVKQVPGEPTYNWHISPCLSFPSSSGALCRPDTVQDLCFWWALQVQKFTLMDTELKMIHAWLVPYKHRECFCWDKLYITVQGGTHFLFKSKHSSSSTPLSLPAVSLNK